MLRAVECTVPDCLHIHAPNDEDLIQLVLRHTHQAHPDVRFGEAAAEALIDESAYDDKKHRNRKGFFKGMVDVGGPGVWG
jgi:hypothetical protein